MRKLFIFSVLLIVLSIPCISHADWVDNWFNNAVATGTGPGMIRGSARNYYGLGYGTMRWQTGVDYPISIGLPSVSFGCGGVDIFLGSMDLMNFDYLVSRLKNIMYSAGAFAFEYALSRLNSKANQILQALDATADSLNQLQLDECKAGKAIAVKLMSPFSKEAAADLGTEQASIKQALGIDSNWHDIWNKWKSSLHKGQTSKQVNEADIQSQQEGCPLAMDDFFSNGKGSVIMYLAWKLLIPQDFVSVIRGVAGDVIVDKNSGAVIRVIPCSQEKGDFISLLLDGKLRACTDISRDRCICSAFTSGAKIREKVQNAITGYLNNLPKKPSVYPYNNGSQSTQEYVIINNIKQYPVYDILKMAYQTGVNPSEISSDSNLVQCSAYFFSAGMLQNILTEAFKINKMVSQWKTWCSHANDVARCKYCDSNVISELEKAINSYKYDLSEILYKQLQVQNLAQKSEACLQLEKTVTLLDKLSNLEKRYSIPVRVK